MDNNDTLKILIVDDEALIAEHLSHIIKKHFTVQISQTHSHKNAITAIENFQPNLVLLDIRLEKNTEGIDLANLLITKYNIPFLFITAFSDDAIMQQAMATKPLAFITKPFKEADIKAAIYVAINFLKTHQQRYFSFKEGNTIIKVNKQDILFAETTNDNYLQLTTTTKKFLIRNSIDGLLHELKDEKFVRIHRSYMANSQAISSVGGNNIFINEISLPLSRKHKEEVVAKLNK